MEEIRWWAPVRPGDVLRGALHVVDVQPSAKHPTRGTIVIDTSLINQDGTVVMTSRGRGLFGRRP